jgi:membrane protease YdiL (CAAX protease family)
MGAAKASLAATGLAAMGWFAVWAVGWWGVSHGWPAPTQASPYPTALPWQLVLWAPVWEEGLFRGMLWHGLKTRWHWPTWAVALLTGSLFAAAHGSYWQNPHTVAYIVWSTAVLTGCRWHTGRVWPSMVCHAAINALALYSP